ncbi:unnamed protein product, partial [marine sediment metagenome]
MIKVTKFYPKDLIAIIVLLACFLLKAIGINTYIDIVIAMVVGFYFARRMNGEGVPGKDINEKVNKLERDRTIRAKFDPVPKENQLTSDTPKGPLTTGDFKPTQGRIQA